MTSPARIEPVDIPPPKKVSVIVVSLFPKTSWYNDFYMPALASYQLGFMYFSDCRKSLFDSSTPKQLKDDVQKVMPFFEAEGVEELAETLYSWLLDEGHWTHYHKQPLKRWNKRKRADPHLLEEIEKNLMDTSTLILLGSEVQRWARRQGLADKVAPENYIELHLPTPNGKHARYWSPENPKVRIGIPRLVAKLKPRVKEKPKEG